ncbi:MAG: glycosyltransferase family 2 protein [Microcella sp.]|uniref:glycosyltransferase family 2 protein n=1 Tax=Microcella sp. TaxID=1913979 RepID=UPI0024CAE3AA|nr:glycosyltransferase family 2 protein [Microcella sp.]UYN84804.1 MAG: glycosyltransferase family 2 protein [Microcella sp.]
MASPASAHPGVSYVMPVYNEAAYIDDAIESVLAQQYPGERELVVVLGPSTDGTTERVTERAAADERIRIVTNDALSIPLSLNLGIRAAAHDIIVRVDAHTELPTDYTLVGVATLLRTSAASVGGLMVATGRGRLQSAIARAYNSRLGLGGGAYHGGASEGPAESAYLGIMRREALLAVGLYDEGLKRGEDWELNQRLREAGHLVWLDPSLQVTYWPRDTWGKLARQFTATGIWRGELVRRLGARNSLRYFAPPALVLSSALSLALMALEVTGLVTGPVAWLLSVVYLGPVLYAVLLTTLLFVRATGERFADRATFAAVIAVMHYSWGAGFVRGVALGARDAVDRSRIES